MQRGRELEEDGGGPLLGRTGLRFLWVVIAGLESYLGWIDTWFAFDLLNEAITDQSSDYCHAKLFLFCFVVHKMVFLLGLHTLPGSDLSPLPDWAQVEAQV